MSWRAAVAMAKGGEQLEFLAKGRLDRPLGNLSSGEPDPTIVESLYSGQALVDIGHHLDGFEQVYLGADLADGGQPGLGALVAAGLRCGPQ